MVTCLVYIGAVMQGQWDSRSGTGMVANHIIFHFVWKNMWLSVGLIGIRKTDQEVNRQIIKKKDNTSG